MGFEELGNPHKNFTAESAPIDQDSLPDEVSIHGINLLEARGTAPSPTDADLYWYTHAAISAQVAGLYKEQPIPHGITVVKAEETRVVDAVYMPLERFGAETRRTLAALHQSQVSPTQ